MNPTPLLLALLCSLLSAIAAAAPTDPLPDRPGLVREVLPNGLTLLAAANATPPGRVALHMVVHAGSLHEADEQRGAAHILAHMAFNGSRRFPPGTLAPFFESLGLTFGRHQNAWLSFTAGHYVLELPRADEQTVRAGLRFFADVADGLLLLDEEFEAERRVALEEVRAMGGPEQRAGARLLPRLLPASRLASRPPMGDEASLGALRAERVRAFYDAWRRPWNVTVIAVGDAPASRLLALAREELGVIEGAPGARSTPDARVERPLTARAVVITDPELTMCQAHVATIDPRPAAVATEADLRRALVDQIGAWAMQRRLQGKIDTGEAVFRRAELQLEDLAGAGIKASAVAWGEPERWRDVLSQLSREVERTRRHGFRAREIDDARREFIARVEGDAAREPSIASAMLARRIANAQERAEPSPSARQVANLTAAALSTITREEVSRAFSARFGGPNALYVLLMPESPGAPTEAETLAVGLGAIAGDVAAEAEPAIAELPPIAPPAPGEVVEVSLHPASGALSAWMNNGARVHHRFTDYRRSAVVVSITLAGGWIEEDERSHALSAAALTAWDRPASHSRSGADIRAMLTGRDVKLSADIRRDALTLTITTSPRDLETALQAAHLLLSEPRIEPAALEQWRETTLQAIAARKTQPTRLLSEVATDAFYPPGERRTRLLEADAVRAVDLTHAQAWLDRLVASGPIEAAIVGDIDRSAAIALAKQYLGSLAERPRIGRPLFADLRRIERAQGPLVRDVTAPTSTPQAVVLVGMFGADASDADAARTLDVAAQALTTRLVREVREEEQLVYSIRALHTPAEAYSGFGLFYAATTVEPARADALRDRLTEAFEAFAEAGPTESEMEVARAQMLNMLDEKMREPEFWARVLADQTYRGRNLDDVAQAPQRLRAVTRERVHGAFRDAWRPQGRFTFVIRPALPNPETGATQAAQ